jgi:hypothetical protein
VVERDGTGQDGTGQDGTGQDGTGQASGPRLAPRRLLAEAVADLRSPTTALGRLARTHVLMLAGDSLVTVALAGTLFFSISPDAARGKVLAYLLLTMAPFAVVAPALGPLLDRGRRVRRTLVAASGALRAALCLAMAGAVHSLLLFPEAFAILVASKLYLVAKSSLVPSTVRTKAALVRANARLSLLGALAGFAAGGLGAALLKIPGLGAPVVLRVDAAVYAAGTLAATRLDRVPELASPGSAPRRAKTAIAASAPLTVVAATAMAVLRGSVGFLTFLFAFALRREHASVLWYGVVLVASVLGSLLATQIAPRLRRAVGEEQLILTALVLLTIAGAGVAATGGYLADAGLAGAAGLAASGAKIAFDALVQRDAPELVQGRAFARFETRFQLAWVVGAVIPVLAALPTRPGALVVSLAAAVAAASFAAGRRALAHHAGARNEPPATPPDWPGAPR